MIFSAVNEDGEPLWKLVMDGRKTVTRRLKPQPIGSIRAIQPKRTAKGIGFIKIIDCRKELYLGQGVVNTETEAYLEGFKDWNSIVDFFIETYGSDSITNYRLKFERVEENSKGEKKVE